MNISAFSIKRPVTVMVVFLAACMFGVVAFLKIPIDMFPEIEIPSISIITTYAGAGAEDVEDKITKPLEDALGATKQLDEMKSTSAEGVSVVSLSFDFGTNLDEAANDIRQNLEFVRGNLPDDASSPMLFQFDFSDMPVLMLAITSKTGDVNQQQDFIRDYIFDPLNRIDGVGSVINWSDFPMEVRVELERDKLERFGLDFDKVAQLIQAQNISVPGGSIQEGLMDFTIRMKGEFDSVHDLEEMVLYRAGDHTVRLKDVGVVKKDLRELRMVTEANGSKAIIGAVMKQSGANTVQVVNDAKAALEGIKKRLPPNIEILEVMDGSTYIVNMIDNLKSTLFSSIILVILVVFMFLKRFKSSLIVAIALPASLVLGFLGMYLAHYTLNMISMIAMSLAIGMVVDNAIVVLENSTRLRTAGLGPKAAALRGVREVGAAITGSTLTTLAVFGPLIFVSGMVSILFAQLSFVIVMTIGSSLLVALTLTPMMCSKMLEKSRERTRRGPDLYGRVEAWYGRFLAFCLGHRWPVVGVSAVMVVGTFVMLSQMGSDFMPADDPGMAEIRFEFPVGTRLEKTLEITRTLAEEMRKQPEVKAVMFRAGADEQGFSTAFGSSSGPHIAEMNVLMVPIDNRTRSDREVVDVLRKRAAEFPEIKKLTLATQDMSAMMSGGEKPITIQVLGDNLDAMALTAEKIKVALGSIEGVFDAATDVPERLPEYRFLLDREKAAFRGVVAAQVGNVLRNALTGTPVSRYRGEDEDIDIRIKLRQGDRQDFTGLERLRVPTTTGGFVELRDLGTFEPTDSPQAIKRVNKQRVYTVGANKGTRALGEIEAELDQKLVKAGAYARNDIFIEKGGDFENQAETFEALGLALLLGFILVYLVMAAQFESFLDPFIIIFSIPFAFTGAFLFLMMAGQSLSMSAILGLIILIGVVVNTAIVMIDYTNMLRRVDGMSLNDAVVTACSRRLRPVLMTSLTTMFGLLPMALKTGSGAAFWQPLGLATFGGMLFSTLVTLILIPVLYSLFERFRRDKFNAPEEDLESGQSESLS
jgi:HAE1 family hydrophobic/amphiphilic exporter-1